MIEKSSNYHKRTIRGVDINDRPKGFEPKRTKGRGIETVAIGKKINEFYETTPDGQTKVMIQEDKNYGKVSDRIQEYASNLWQRLSIDIDEILRAYKTTSSEDSTANLAMRSKHLFQVPPPVSLYHQS